MSTIKTVAITAASGSLGSVIFKKLVNSGKFKVRVLKRLGSNSTFPSGTDVVEVDYQSVESLTAALEGQDAVISCVTSADVGTQGPLVDAAVAAGVKRFLPSEFGSDVDNPKTRQLPPFAPKAKIQDYIISKAKGTDFTYTFVYNSGFLDWGLEHKFLLDLSEYAPPLFDGGDKPFSTTTLNSVADAVVGVLTHFEETKNRAVFIRDIETTQNKILALAKKVAPSKPWKPSAVVKLSDAMAEAYVKLGKGDYSMGAIIPFLLVANFDASYGGRFGSDNELLGVKGVTEDDIIELLKPLLK